MLALITLVANLRQNQRGKIVKSGFIGNREEIVLEIYSEYQTIIRCAQEETSNYQIIPNSKPLPTINKF